MVKEKNNELSDTGAHVEEIDDKLIKLFSYISAGDISPMQAVIGSITAQEVIKACSGKFHPIKQNFYFDALEIIPSDYNVEEMEKLCQPVSNKHSHC